MSKKIIRLSSNQVLQQVFSNSQNIANTKNVEPQTFFHQDMTLRGVEKACGLFNPLDIILEDISIENYDIENQKQEALLMDLLDMPNFLDESIENDLFFENENMNPIDHFSDSQKPQRNISKFAKKVQDLNLKINIPSQQTMNTSFGSADSIKNNKITPILPTVTKDINEITPETEKMYMQFIQSIPGAQLQINQGALGSNFTTITTPPINFEFLDEFGTEENFQKLILGCTSDKIIPAEPLKPIVHTDHEYISVSNLNKDNKRKLSTDNFFDDSCDSFSSSIFTDSLSSSNSLAKKSRTRGIYRADDVTNEKELQNYLERRKKNNISSKVSRSNKKKSYSEMDSKCDEYEKNNKRLETKIIELEHLNKVIKEFLVERFTQKP